MSAALGPSVLVYRYSHPWWFRLLLGAVVLAVFPTLLIGWQAVLGGGLWDHYELPFIVTVVALPAAWYGLSRSDALDRFRFAESKASVVADSDAIRTEWDLRV